MSDLKDVECTLNKTADINVSWTVDSIEHQLCSNKARSLTFLGTVHASTLCPVSEIFNFCFFY